MKKFSQVSMIALAFAIAAISNANAQQNSQPKAAPKLPGTVVKVESKRVIKTKSDGTEVVRGKQKMANGNERIVAPKINKLLQH